MNKKKRKEFTPGQIVFHIILIIASLTYILPLILMLSISVSSESAIEMYGYSFWPKEWGFDGYKAILKNPKQILDAYKVTIIFSFTNTLLSMLVQSMCAYPLSRRNYKLRKFTTNYLFITMLFSGGLVPTYILNSKYLHLDNTIWIYIIPGLIGAWTVFIMRTFFQGLPDGLVEAAKIDGASEFRVFIQILMPLCTPMLASLGFMHLIGKWNDWNTALIYIRDTELYSLQYLLQKILREADFVNKMAQEGADTMGMKTPTETMRYAMAVVAAGPMMIVFPFFQKYFAAGLTIGSVKG